MANPTDSRVRAWPHSASAGVTETWRFTVNTPDDAPPVSTLALAIGGTVTDVDDLTGATLYEAAVVDGVAVVQVDIPTGSSQALRLLLDGVVKTVDRLHPSTRGSKSGTQSFTVDIGGDVTFDLEVLGTAVVGGAFFIDADGYLVALVPSPDDSLTFDDDGLILLTIGD